MLKQGSANGRVFVIPEIGAVLGVALTVELVSYASFLRIYVSMRNRVPVCVTNLRKHA